MSNTSNKEDLLELLKVMSQPKKHGLTRDALDQALISFCAKCPDPVRARWLVVECLDPMTDEELVDRALDMPLRSMTDVPSSTIPANHPARTMMH